MLKPKSSRYDLHVKVPGVHKPFYVVRRRIIDGGYECSCPRWNEAREECKHVRPVKAALAAVPRAASSLEEHIRQSSLEERVRRCVIAYPYFIPQEEDLIKRLIKATRGV